MNSSTKEYIYILELNGGNYYVGKTKDIVKRFNDHKSQKGSAWTKQHACQTDQTHQGCCKIIEIYECTSLFDEDKYTLEYMNAMGIDNVRGGSYANCVLTTEQRNNITRALRNANNLCMSCGESDHFSDMCSTSVFKLDTAHTHKTQNNQNNQNNGNIEIDKIPIVDLNERPIFHHVRYLSPTGIVHDNTENTENITHSVNEFIGSSCGRCGRNNHITTKCFAKTNVYGKPL